MNPVADPDSQVVVGRARFTVLTSRLLRLEWSPTTQFEDRGTYAFPHRAGTAPPYESWTDDGSTVIDTGDLLLRYVDDDQAFSEANLSIELTGAVRGVWTPGTVDLANLGGARRTVDGCRGDATLEPGLVSRSGWAVFDDSAGIPFAADGWVETRGTTDAQDWYFFGYGHDYAAAVSDYTRFGGSAPLVPRWMLGAWWSKYWPYSDPELRQLVADFRSRDLPLDIVVLDMDWHTTDSWTGYSWNRELFPDPRGFMDWLHSEHLHTTLNLHPALGVQSFEDAYPAFAVAMGVDPASREPVAFQITDPEFVRNYFELLHHPLEDSGVDFWWIDWQQGRTSELAGLDPLAWLNHLHFRDFERRPDRRPVIFSRWGGLGSHRYPIGFSGDSFALWSALQFQPRYTAAGANVGYGWWSHDIGGHSGAADPELYVRWVQFGALSPILRLHSQQFPEAERRPWMFGPEVLDAAREAFELRYTLVPYLYTAARIATDTGRAIVRPTAWIAPEDDGAYVARYQYLLGDSLLVAPVMQPADPATGLAEVDVYLPAGEWIERTTGETCAGRRWVKQLAGLRDIPQFVRPGTVLPLAGVAQTTVDQDQEHLVLSVFSGADGTTRVYEDDGDSSAFQGGAYGWTTISTSTPDPTRCLLRISAVEGRPVTDRRAYTVRFEHTAAPTQVLLDGAVHGDWRHDGAATVVEVPAGRRDRDLHLSVSADGPLSRRGADHDQQLRARDLSRLLGDGADISVAAVCALAPDRPGRAAAIARGGGPSVQVFEYTAPDEAAAQLGHLVVGAPVEGPTATVAATWTIQRGTAVSSVSTGPDEVGPPGLVLACPGRWDQTLTPTRWSVEATLTWGDVVITKRHSSDTFSSSVPAWQVLVVDAADAPAAEAVHADLASATPQLAWRRREVDVTDVDFGRLTDPYVMVFILDSGLAEEGSNVAYAATTLSVPTGRDVAFGYLSGADVGVYVDGAPVTADVSGTTSVSIFALHPKGRRTGSVRLEAGEHSVLFVCAKNAETWVWDWYLSATCVDPETDRPLLDVTAAI